MRFSQLFFFFFFQVGGKKNPSSFSSLSLQGWNLVGKDNNNNNISNNKNKNKMGIGEEGESWARLSFPNSWKSQFASCIFGVELG